MIFVFAMAAAAKRSLGTEEEARGLPKVRRVLEGTPTSANCTWRTLSQPLDHFARGTSPETFSQRACIFEGFVKEFPPKKALFYCGNESPVDEYVNNTGLMWQVGEEIGALLVFVEHRYEGESVPRIEGVRDCLGYCTIEQALADYAKAVAWLRETYASSELAVVAVGGSYGGMLAAWFRMKYPSATVGAIAASAPIWGLPTLDWILDGSSVAVARSFGVRGGQETDACRENLLGAWPIIAHIGETAAGRDFLAETMHLCSPPASGRRLAAVIQNVFFDLAEANYPFASAYVTSAVGGADYPLPAWPIRAACAKLQDPLVAVAGNVSAVEFSVKIDDLTVAVAWDEIASVAGDFNTSGVRDLLEGVAYVWQTWCNVSGTLACLEPTGCTTGRRRRRALALDVAASPSADDACTAADYDGGSWTPLCCNDDLTLLNYYAQGMGRDGLYWPPNYPRNITASDVLGPYGSTGPGCSPPVGLAGYPPNSDPWSRWMIDEFGDRSAALQTSNIVFSNGLLDPWSAAGVYRDFAPTEPAAYDGPNVQNITDTVHAFILDLGAHHLDLMFLHDTDPPCAWDARAFETAKIKAWLGS
ncbi:hypothetical protein CTAYLR_009964 [Chrysophaeum taylorii]|uniref:Lysosomal Pro-X carboxypeptidase n=1 Tax=Chrysophaeum taylorii TaxID=2483200 RepID=A0AAD7XGW9_9STRA|nr:hypothetical protein CTAYLR_009964 [Chrysophaeum taylorii]